MMIQADCNYSQVGAVWLRHLWTMLFLYPLMSAIQEISAYVAGNGSRIAAT